ncbi:4Fe-4S dicluster domain-containing protein [Ferrimonas lipolytica]|uniref:4Fe-4S dicluster domain-containing protein n=1 Tax=Ferrimonas lipolytica TaxID=2724191 RepID=A0A6H1UEL0_9GAMM|nr:4Fe-4S dicluster domain-containing protein [Ferrimonas lipolytica]QIZ76232.1 4Fe-4S dicluster domain-containing protein [Ferrimonas lipolytica]
MNRFVVADPKLCIGCGTCMAACSETHKKQGLQIHPRLTVMKHQQVTAPVLCRHCEDAPCIKVCPVKAISQQDGSVIVNESKCVGCTLCAIVCPFGAISTDGSRPVDYVTSFDTFIPSDPNSSNPSTSSPRCFGNGLLAWEPGVKAIAVKCDLCRHRKDGPACVGVCPTGALVEMGGCGGAAARKTKQTDQALVVDRLSQGGQL